MQDETITQEEVSLRDYLDLLRRRSAVIIQMCVAALVIGVFVAFVSNPVYKSAGRLLVTPSNPTVIAQNSSDPIGTVLNQSKAHNIETQLEMLMTPSLLGEAYKISGETPGDPRISVAVGRRSEEIDIIDITVEAYKAASAEAVANNLMELYIKNEQKLRNGDLTQAINYAETQLQDVTRDWEKVEKELQSFQDRTKIVDYTETVKGTVATTQSLGSKEKELEASIAGNQAAIDKTRSYLKTLPRTIKKKVETTNPQLQLMRQKLTDLKIERDGKLQLFRADHPVMKQYAALITEQENAITKASPTIVTTDDVTNPELLDTEMKLRNMEALMAQLRKTADTNSKQKNQAVASTQNMGKLQYQQALLAQRREIAQEQSKILKNKLADLKLRESAQPKPISVLNRASLNPSPVRPKKALIIGLSLLVGLFLGVCFALLAEFMDDRVNAPEDARRLMGVPALGYVPRIDKEEQRMLTSATAGGSLLESYRVLRSNVRFAAVGEPLHSIMVTSTAPGEGKSVTAANLAIAMALDGKRVILVDADLRRPTVHEKFGVRNTPGLTNVLVGALTIDKALQATEVENLKLLTSGPIPPNPAELLNSRAMEQVQEMLKERCDVLILDSPPCLSVADAQVLAATVDGLIYVVQLGSTKKSALRHGNELLRQAHARILGVVYNKVQVDGRRNDYYYGYYSYYHKSELPGKGNGNGNGKTASEWDNLLSQSRENGKTALAKAPAKVTDTESSDLEKG